MIFVCVGIDMLMKSDQYPVPFSGVHLSFLLGVVLGFWLFSKADSYHSDILNAFKISILDYLLF